MGFSRSYSPSGRGADYFQPGQIVCLEYAGSYLYAEVIQVVEERQVCWARPLILAVYSVDKPPCSPNQPLTRGSDPQTLFDLRQVSDLLLPKAFFREALDTEVIPLLTELQTNKVASEERDSKLVKHQFSQFIHKVCQAHSNHC